MTAPEAFDTERLRAARIRAEDLAALRAALDADPRVMASLGGRPLTEEESRASMARHLAHWEVHGFGVWVFRGLKDECLVGRGGLLRYDLEGEETAGLLYHLAADAWGQGFATEIARASLRAGFEELGLSSIGCWTQPTNRASRRVMEKCGFVYEREGLFRDLPHVFFRITRVRWREARDA